MRIEEKYIEQLKECLVKGLKCDRGGHYQTTIDFAGKTVYVSPDGEDIVRYRFNLNGCMKTKYVWENGVRKELLYHKERLPVYGRITNKKNMKALLYKYLLFLRCDGVEDRDLMMLYLLKCIADKFEFWRRHMIRREVDGKIVLEYKKWELYYPDYEDMEKMIVALIRSALKKTIDETTREQFAVRTRCVVNPEEGGKYSGIRKKTRKELLRDAKRGLRPATDNRIRTHYDPTLSDKENAERANVCLSRFKEWKSDHRDEVETLKDRIQRMYDPALSLRKNADVIGCSVNSVRNYADKLKETQAVEVKSEDDWIDNILEKENEYWGDVPSAKREVDEDDLLDLLKDLE